MTTDVTVLGTGGVTISIPVSSAVNAQLAQTALDPLNNLIASGNLDLYNVTITGAASVPLGPGGSTVTGIEVTIPGVVYLPTVPGDNKLIYVSAENAAGANTVFAVGSVDPTVVSGYFSSLFYTNNSVNVADAFFGGGQNYFVQGAPTAEALIFVDGSTVSALSGATTGIGSAYIDGSQGSATIELFDNAVAYLNTGGTNNVIAQGGSAEVLGLGGSTTIPVSVTAVAGAQLFVQNSATGQVNVDLNSGSFNYVGELTSTASAVVNVNIDNASGQPTTLTGATYVDGSQGSTTVNLYSNSFVYLQGGGNDLVVAQPGSNEVLGIGGSSTVPVSITGSVGSSLLIFNDASTFIDPSAGNIVLAGGLTDLGTATLFGTTGSDTVFGSSGSGYFQGGSAGNNVILSSTVSGATTILGGGNNDYLAANASNDSVVAGSGTNDTLAAFNSTAVTLIGGSGTDTLLGSTTGDNYIGFGSGTALAFGNFGAAGAAGNVYFQAAAGGTDNIGDFLPGTDVFSLTLSTKFEGASSPITISSISSLGANGTTVQLSDGSTINFLNAKVTSSNFT
jgi:hypothetical protein